MALWSAKKPKLERPYWHVDMKWMCALALLITLGASLLFYNLSTLTKRASAISISTNIVASLFSKNGLDDPKGLEEFRQKAAKSAGSTIAPIDQFPSVKISKQDALDLSPRDLRIKIFSQITAPIYDKGLEGAAAAQTSDKKAQQKFVKNASLLGVFTKKTHDILQNLFVITAVLSAVFLAALIYFSSGWGRLVSPAIVLMAISPMGAIAALLFTHPPADGNSPVKSLPSGVAHEIGSSLSHSYLNIFILGVGLIVLAVIGKLAERFLIKKPKPAAARAN